MPLLLHLSANKPKSHVLGCSSMGHKYNLQPQHDWLLLLVSGTGTKSMLNQTELMLFGEQTTIMKSWGAGQMESDSVRLSALLWSGCGIGPITNFIYSAQAHLPLNGSSICTQKLTLATWGHRPLPGLAWCALPGLNLQVIKPTACSGHI